MPNVVPFTKLSPERAVDNDFHRAIHNLDFALHKTRGLIDRCPQGPARDEFESWFLHLQHLLDVARGAAQGVPRAKQEDRTQANVVLKLQADTFPN
jgi:hypothetical protein